MSVPVPLPAFEAVCVVYCSANVGVSGVELSERRTTVDPLVLQVRAVD